MGSGASFINNQQNKYTIRYIQSLSTNNRRKIANVSSRTIVTNIIHQQQLNPLKQLKNYTFNPSNVRLPCVCPICFQDQKKNDKVQEIFTTLYDIKYHYVNCHTCTFSNLLIQESYNSLNRPSALFQSLQYLGPSEIIDISNTCSWLYIACESNQLWRPWGKGVYSRVFKTYQRSKNALSLVKVTGKVMEESHKNLNRAKNQLTSIVEGNRITLLKVHKPNATQYTVAAAILGLLLSSKCDSRSPDFDSFRRLLSFIKLNGVNISLIENKLEELDVSTVPYDHVMRCRPYIEMLRKDMKMHDGLNPYKYKIEHVNTPSRSLDVWTRTIAIYLIQFDEYWHNYMFCLAANESFKGTVSALKQSTLMLNRLNELDSIWMSYVQYMHSHQTSKRKARYNVDGTEIRFKRARERKNKIDRLAANGYPEYWGHYNIHEMLNENNDNWEFVLEILQKIHPPMEADYESVEKDNDCAESRSRPEDYF